MAEKSADGSSTILCKYFMHNACQKGSNCPFSHDRTTPPDLVCRYYLKGQCMYGDQCRYDHVRDRSDKGSKKSTTTPSLNQKFKSNLPPSKKEKQSPNYVKVPSPLPTSQTKDEVKSRPVPLGKDGEKKVTSPVNKTAEEWVKAKEFVPGQFYTGAVPPTYASAVGQDAGLPIQEGYYDYAYTEDVQWTEGEAAALGSEEDGFPVGTASYPLQGAEAQPGVLCPFMMQKGECPYEACQYVHGDFCDMCGLAILHPTDQKQRDDHVQECIKSHEEDMQHSFAMAKSADKQCGICMETVVEKARPDNRFGVLESCNHCFCLPCIRKWRCAKKFEKIVVRACPECRVQSNFVTPSEYWVDTPEEKKELIEGYKKTLSDKPCRYFDEGRGDCPFNESCFYRHALPDGTVPPPGPRRQRRRMNADNQLEPMQRIRLWDFLEEADARRSLDDVEELLNYLTLLEFTEGVFHILDSDGSDSDDYF